MLATRQIKTVCQNLTGITNSMKYHKRWCLKRRPRREQFESFRLHANAKRLFRKEQRRMIRKSEENGFKELSDAAEIDNIKFWKYVSRCRNWRTMKNVNLMMGEELRSQMKLQVCWLIGLTAAKDKMSASSPTRSLLSRTRRTNNFAHY